MPGSIAFSTDKTTQAGLVSFIQQLTARGIQAFRFERQVPATRDYPKGVASSQWLNLKTHSKRDLTNYIGSMMTPGVDFVRRMRILEEDIPKLPLEFRKAIFRDMKS